MRATKKQKAHRKKFAKAAKICSKKARIGAESFRHCMSRMLKK